MGEFKQMWIDAWDRSFVMRFWRMTWLRQFFLAGVGLFCFGMLTCVILWAFNGHHKSGTLYDISGAIAITGDIVMMLSIILFCVIDIGNDIIRFIR